MLLALAATAAGSMLLTRGAHGALPPPPAAQVPYREAIVAAQRPLVLDPLLARTDPASRDVSRLLYRCLLRLDGHGQPSADLAGSWGVSGDGTVYRFTLRPGLRWSDGTQLTVDDVAATVASVQDPGFADPALGANWHGVTVATDPGGAVTMTLPAARASFAALVADLPILPRALAAQPAAARARIAPAALPTSGPYRVRSSDRSAVVLVASTWVSPRPGLGELDLRLLPTFDAASRALAAGQVDALEAVTPSERTALAGLHGVTLHDSLSFRFADLILNTRRPGLDDLAVRRAFASTIDRRRLIAVALDNAARPQVDAEPLGILWLGPGTPEQPDPELSRRALDAAGWTAPSPGATRSRGGVPLRLTLSVPDVPPLPGVAAELARQLGDIGVAVDVRPVRADRMASDVLTRRDFDLALVDWDSGPDPDISSFWRSNAAPPAGFNLSGTPSDLFLDRALDGLATETDPQLRQTAARRVEQRLADEVPAVFLYAPVTTFATGPRLQGVTVPDAGTPAERYDGVTSWTLVGSR